MPIRANRGREVATPMNEKKDAGSYSAQWRIGLSFGIIFLYL